MNFRALLSLMTVVLALGILALWYKEESTGYRISIAAGPRSAQSFELVMALKDVAERHYPEIEIEVFETRGSLQNAKLLERGAVDLATIQAGQVTGGGARLVAELYSDAFQLVVRQDSGIEKIGDLAGKRIALPLAKSGENETFWFLASHYGLSRDAMVVFPGTDATTDWLLINGDADALFRVRPPGDASVLRLMEKVNAQIVAIPQAAALRLRRPALDVGIIPQGSYNGRPAIPSKDLPTITVKRLLVARADIADEAIAKITSVLFERRRELIAHAPLAGSVAAPQRASGTFLPMHAGAQAFYDRDRPSFLQENAEPIALMVSVLVVLFSAFVQVVSWRRKRVMDSYNRELLELSQHARAATTFETLDECHTRLADFVGRIVKAAEAGQINSSEFNLFNFTYEAVEDAIRDRELQLERAERSSRRQTRNAPAGSSSQAADASG